MLKPSFRFFIIPLGAICTLASLSAQNTAPRAQRDTGTMLVREQVVDCSNKNPSEVCVISHAARPSAEPTNFLTDQFFCRPSLLPPKNLQRPGRDAPLRVALYLGRHV